MCFIVPNFPFHGDMCASISLVSLSKLLVSTDHNGVNLITKEAHHGKGAPADDKLIDEWIRNGGKFNTGGSNRRAPRGDRGQQSVPKKNASTVATKKSAPSAAKGKTAGDSGKKRGRSSSNKKTSGKKLSKAQKKKMAKLEKEMEKMKKLMEECAGEGSDSESDSSSEDEDQPPKKKGAVEAALDDVKKMMGADDSDDDATVGEAE